MFSAKQICDNFVAVNYYFPKNTTTKNAFLAVCRYLDENVDLRLVNERAPSGGKIGPGDSKLDKYFRFSKIMRLHAIFHDAHGYMRSFENVGPGYVYTMTDSQYFHNSMFFGHFSGIAYWTMIKLFHRKHFDDFPF